MIFSLDNMFGVHETALKLRAQRSEIIAANIANSDTPGYKARDIDFSTALKQAQSGQSSVGLSATREGHISDTASSVQHDGIRYRVPFQAALDGNTVESQVEQAAFAKNAVEYQATLTFIEGRISTLKQAIKGGE
ncbi:MAG: flagellar basal body rod protein FlgB [Gammaproteobacteria bacterium]|nr:flagellar basal body rod protein FlgB [Gammaproteobacteria bacterium]